MSLDSELRASGGFQVKYLGAVSFTRKKRRPLKGIVSLQRPLLDLYTGARRRGEHQRSAHPLALTQQLEVCDYGLVVAEGTGRGETVITKVITPLSNVILWAAVRFHAKIIKKRVLGAAFVPLACSEGALDPKSYVCLSSRQRFLVSLSHPAVFACIHRSVSTPTVFECHAFVCATAEDALSAAGLAASAGNDLLYPAAMRDHSRIPQIAASVDSGTDYCTTSDITSREQENFNNERRRNSFEPDTEEESNSYASVGQRRNRIPVQKKHTHYREARALIGRCEGRRRLAERRRAFLSAEHQGSGVQQLRATTRERPTEELAETIDLSSESSFSAGAWRPVEQPLVKYTYFGYETYARPSTESELTVPPEQPRHMRENRKNHRISENGRTAGIIRGNGTGKVTISVPYGERRSPESQRTVPQGVRSFYKNGHVRNWSSLSQTSASSSSSYIGIATLSPSKRNAQPKVIRWSSEDRFPRRRSGGIFWSLKRMGIQSLTRARNRTGKFLTSVKTKLMGSKRFAEGSEDSAYDTSEVCLSPNGRQASAPGISARDQHLRQPTQKSAARRQQSWSFHDLRSASIERPTVRKPQRRKPRRRKKGTQSSSSSDSGVEAAYHSDNSVLPSDPARKAPSKNAVTRVRVTHGMGTDTFNRWSHTNIHDELGYIP